MFPESVMRWGRQWPMRTEVWGNRRRPKTRTYHLRHGGRQGIAVSEFSRDCLAHLMDYPDLPIHLNPRQIVKTDLTTLLLRTELRVSSGPVEVAYKRIQRRTLIKTLTSILRPGRLLRSWRVGHHLLAREVATPRPYAVIAAPWYAWRADGYLMTQWITGAVPADVFVNGLAHEKPHVRHKVLQAAAVELGRLIGQLHAAQVAHRDLKAGNLLLRQEQGEAVSAWVIDLEGAAIVTRISWARRYKNLARLAVCFQDDPQIPHSVKLRFCRAYLDVCREDCQNWKSFWRALSLQSQRLWSRKQRRKTARV